MMRLAAIRLSTAQMLMLSLNHQQAETSNNTASISAKQLTKMSSGAPKPGYADDYVLVNDKPVFQSLPIAPIEFRIPKGDVSCPLSDDRASSAACSVDSSAGAVTLNSICPGIVAGDFEIAACLQAYNTAQTGPATVIAPVGHFTYRSTVKLVQTLHFHGQGDGSLFASAQSRGGPAGSFIDIGPNAPKSEIDHIKIDGQNSVRNFTNAANGQYLATDPILDESSESNIHDLTITDAFDNCLSVSMLNPTTGASVVGSPVGYSIRHIRTSYCGNGAQKAGGGVNIASGQAGTVDDVVDTGSYGGVFLCDTGAGAQGNFSNLTSLSSAHNPGQSNYALYAGCSNSTYNNIEIISPGFVPAWFDNGAINNSVTNLIVKGSTQKLLLKSVQQFSLFGLVLESYAGRSGTGDAIQVDSSAAPTLDLTLSGVSVRGGGAMVRYGVDFTGTVATSNFTASITGNVLLVSALAAGSGPLAYGQMILPANSLGVPPGTLITGQLRPASSESVGGVGRYTLSNGATVASEGMSTINGVTGSIQGNFDGAVTPYNNLPTTVTLPQFLPAKNLIDNPAFAVNQRGYVSGASLAVGAYGFDRWAVNGGATSYAYSTSGLDTTITISGGAGIVQTVPSTRVAGGSYVLSWRGTARSQVNYGGNYLALMASPFVFSVPSGTQLNITFGAGTLTDVQLEAGYSPTPFERRSYEDELRRCLPFFQLLQLGMGAWDSSPTRFDMPTVLFSPMVKTPKATLLSRGRGITVPGAANYAITGLNENKVSSLGPNGGFLEIDTAPSTVYRPGYLLGDVRIGLSSDF